MPLMPYMSPAAIGCSVVRLRGAPSRSKRSPIACSTLSGQPRPLDELTVTTSPELISDAARSAEITFFMRAVSIRKCARGDPGQRAVQGQIRLEGEREIPTYSGVDSCQRRCDRNRNRFPSAARFTHGNRRCQRPHAIFTARCRLTVTAHRRAKSRDTAHVQILVRDGQLPLALLATQEHVTDRTLRHHVATDQRTLVAMNLDAGARMFDRERVVDLRQH